MRKLNKSGFSMIELLVVLLIIGILAAVAAPLFLGNTERAKVSEAVSVLGQIRSAEREYFVKHNSYLAVASGNLGNDPEVAANKGLGIVVGATQYFSSAAYTVATGGTFTNGDTAADFVITANGANSVAIVGNAGAQKPGEVSTYRVQMDNSGKTLYSTDSGTTWKSF